MLKFVDLIVYYCLYKSIDLKLRPIVFASSKNIKIWNNGWKTIFWYDNVRTSKKFNLVYLLVSSWGFYGKLTRILHLQTHIIVLLYHIILFCMAIKSSTAVGDVCSISSWFAAVQFMCSFFSQQNRCFVTHPLPLSYHYSFVKNNDNKKIN